MKTKLFKSGATTQIEKLFPSGMYLVEIRDPSGTIHDKMRCDDYQDALAYLKSFNKIASNNWR